MIDNNNPGKDDDGNDIELKEVNNGNLIDNNEESDGFEEYLDDLDRVGNLTDGEKHLKANLIFNVKKIQKDSIFIYKINK